MNTHNHTVILSAQRSPIGQFNGCFKSTPSTELGAQCIAAVLSQSNIDSTLIDQVIMGCVLAAGLGQAPARQAALGAKLPTSTPCSTVNKMCGSGMQAVMMGSDAIQANSAEFIIAGGMENMSLAPYLLAKARSGYRFGHDTLFDHMLLDGLEDAYNPGKSMGYFAEHCAAKYGFSREAQDAFAKSSLQRALEAIEQNKFSDEICPITLHSRKGESIITNDEGPLSINPEKISALKPAFINEGTITAATASSISDGASALLISSSQAAANHKLQPIARIVAHHSHAQDPAWFSTAPIAAINGVLKKAQWTLSDVDLFEINEAFAVVTMACMQALNIPHDTVNVNGGACVLGHPIGASGARIITTLIHALQQRQLSRGVASLCIGGGEATAIAIELTI